MMVRRRNVHVASLVEAVSAAVGSSTATAVFVRGWWSKREIRQQRAFRRAVEDIVRESAGDLIRWQAEMERRQGRHLDRQDRKIDDIAQQVRQLQGFHR